MIGAAKPTTGPRTPLARSLRILVLEDDAIIGMLLAEMLEEMGHEVCAIEATESRAISAASRCKPELVIVDGRLRNGSGISAVDKICLAEPIPHLFLSGDVSGVRALRPDAIVVQKPFRESDLAKAIQSTFDRAGLDRSL
jgi:DNA-binding response OmpR family regulator